MMDYVIEDGIPVPGIGGKNGSVNKTALIRSLKPGQSIRFGIPGDTGLHQFRNKISGIVSIVRVRTGNAFATRTDGNGIRVWRIS